MCFFFFTSIGKKSVTKRRKLVAAKSNIVAHVQLNNQYNCIYDLIKVEKIDQSWFPVANLPYILGTQLEKINCTGITLDENSMTIHGYDKLELEWTARFDGANVDGLKSKLLETTQEVPQTSWFTTREFDISLLHGVQNKLKKFVLSEAQAQQITGQTSYTSMIMATCGVGGLIALLYYFDLIPKTLLGRG